MKGDTILILFFVFVLIVTTISYHSYYSNTLKHAIFQTKIDSNSNSVEDNKLSIKNQKLSELIGSGRKLASKNMNISKVTSKIEEKPEILPRVVESFEKVPNWVREYSAWHKEQRSKERTDDSIKYLIVACHNGGFCGGVSDRLKSLPYFLYFGYKTNRVILIKWQKYDLEDFLEPPTGGINWTMPEELDIGAEPDELSLGVPRLLEDLSNKLHSKKNLVVRSNADLYQKFHNEFKTKQHETGTFRFIMGILFQLTKPLKRLIVKTMWALELRPKNYLAVHYRGFDNSDKTDKVSEEEKQGIINSINCVIHQTNNTSLPIYFAASDSKFVEYALKESPFAAKNNPKVKVVGIHDIVRYHSDKVKKSTLGKAYSYKNNPADLYPVFMDLWIMGGSKCVSYGMLGFGKFSFKLAGEKCGIFHQKTTCPSALS